MTNFRLLECLLVENGCYKQYHNCHILPTGITVHSTDLAGSVLKRYVQPVAGQTIGLKDGDRVVSAEEMFSILGKNVYGNSWNRSGADVCPHAAIGKLADGSYAVAKTLDFTQPCWGAAFGPNGSYDGRIIVNGAKIAGGPLNVQFEMIEDGSAGNKDHCKAMYELAVDFCVYLCRQFPSIKIENIISHKEAHARGRGSNHGDPESYWKRCGMPYTMAGFRAEVKNRLEDVLSDMTKAEFEAVLKERDEKLEAKLEAICDKLSREYGESLQGALLRASQAAENVVVENVGQFITHLSDIPTPGLRAEFKPLLDEDFINGGTTKEEDATDIRLPLSTVRALIIVKRYLDSKILALLTDEADPEECGETCPIHFEDE